MGIFLVQGIVTPVLIAFARILFNTYLLQCTRLMFVKLRGCLSNGFVCRVLQAPTVSNRQNC